jgi:hypothetical protein
LDISPEVQHSDRLHSKLQKLVRIQNACEYMPLNPSTSGI